MSEMIDSRDVALRVAATENAQLINENVRLRFAITKLNEVIAKLKQDQQPTTQSVYTDEC